jgi:hypothetical protein
MKILILDGMPFMYPEDISNIDDYIDYVNENFYRFMPMNELSLDNCVYPYFVEDDIKVRYINLSLVKSIFEDDVELLSRYEYDERLKDLQEEICVNCKHYYENPDGDNLEGHRDEMRLDGFCPNFEPINDDEEDEEDEDQRSW